MFDHHIDPVRGLAVIRLSDTVTGDELKAAVTTLLADPDYRPEMGRLWDARGIRQLVIDVEDLAGIRKLLEGLKEDLSRSKSAIVAVRKIDLEFAELFRAYTRGRSVRIFVDYDEARCWLDT